MTHNYTIRLSVICLLLCWLSHQQANAQNIDGEIIKVSPLTSTLIKFSSGITQYNFDVRNKYSGLLMNEKRNIIIRTMDDKPVATKLYITEGSRSHLFIIQVLEDADINKAKTSYDFSDLKQVKQLIAKSGKPEKEETAAEKAERQKQEEEDARKETEEKKRINDSIANVPTIMAKVSADAKKKQDELAAQKLKDAQAEAAKAQAEAAKAQAKLAEAERQAKLEKDAADQKAALEAANAKKAADAEKLKKQQEETAARLQKEAADKKAAEEAAAKLKQEKAEEARLAALAKTEEQRKQLEKAKQEAEEKRKADEAKAEELRIARQKKLEEDQEKAKQQALALQAAREAKEAELKAAREAAEAKRQQELKEKQEALAAANALKKQKEEEAKAAAEAQRIQNEKLAQEKLQLAKEKAMALEMEKKEKKRVADSLAALPRTYTNAELFKKYPRILFGAPPPDQRLSPWFGDVSTAGDSAMGKKILADKPVLHIVSDTFADNYFVLEDIRFKELGCYLKIRVKNNTPDDFLVGAISFTWNRKADTTWRNIYPTYVSNYPAMPPKTERTLVYAMPMINAAPEDRLMLRVGDRMKVIGLFLEIPTDVYLDRLQKAED